jgi:hypothetical protein
LSVFLKILASCMAALVLGAAPVVSAQQPARRERSWEVPVTVCGLSFRTTNDWVLTPESKGQYSGCQAQLRAKNYDRLVGSNDPVHFWMIGIEVQAKRLDDLMDFYDIAHEGDRWFVGPGARERPAYEIRGAGWWGLKVDDMSMRSSSRGGSGSFESSATWVLATNTGSAQTAIFVAGDGSTDQALPLLITTLKFGAR